MKRVFQVVLVLSVLFLGASNVNAMTPTFPSGAKFTRGVSNTCYYIDSSASGYTTMINTAAQQWAGMSNNIVNTPVSSSYATHMDIYARTPSTDTNLNNNTNAYTTFWDAYGNYITGPNYNYFYTEIILNQWYWGMDSSTVAHEMGHAYGLAHTSNQYSIMYTPKSGRLVSTPQSVDNDTINYLYP